MTINDMLSTAKHKLEEGDLAKAEALFAQIAADAPEAELHQKALIGSVRALMGLGRVQEAQAAAQEALQLWPEGLHVLLVNADCAKLAGDPAFELLCYRRAFAAAPKGTPGLRNTVSKFCRALFAAGQGDEVHALYEAYVAKTGDEVHLLWVVAQAYMESGDIESALSLWQQILDQPKSVDWARKLALKNIGVCLVHRAEYSKLRALFDSRPEAGPERQILLSALPPDPGPEGMRCFSTQFLKSIADANPSAEQPYLQRLSTQRSFEGFREIGRRQFARSGLQRTNLKAQIAAIKVLPQKGVASEALYAFWELCERPFGSLQAWREAVAWEAQANNLVRLLTFLETDDEDLIFEEISGITAPPDYSLVHTALEGGKGCLLAGSHLGPVWANAFLTSRHFANLGIIGGYPRPRLGRADKDVSMRLNPLQARRTIQRYLSQNAIMWCGPDSVHKNDPKNLFSSAFGPLPVQVSYAHIQYRTGAPCLWNGRYWQDEQVHILFKPMPSPEPDEGLQSFVRRWCEAYLAYQVHHIKHRLADARFAYVIGRDWSY